MYISIKDNIKCLLKRLIYATQVANPVNNDNKISINLNIYDTTMGLILKINFLYLRQNLELWKVIICNITALAPVFWEHKYISWELNRMEQIIILNGRQPHRMTTSQEDDLTGRQPQRNTNSQEDDLTGRQTHRKTTTQTDNLTGKRPHRMFWHISKLYFSY